MIIFTILSTKYSYDRCVGRVRKTRCNETIKTRFSRFSITVHVLELFSRFLFSLFFASTLKYTVSNAKMTANNSTCLQTRAASASDASMYKIIGFQTRASDAISDGLDALAVQFGHVHMMMSRFCFIFLTHRTYRTAFNAFDGFTLDTPLTSFLVRFFGT